MAEKGTQSIYEIDFAVLDEKKYSEAVKVPAAALVEEVGQNGSVPEPVGRIAMSAEVVNTSPVSLDITQPTEVVINIPRPVEVPPPYIPPEYVELAQTAIDSLLEAPTKPIIPIAQIVDKALGQRAPRQNYWNLKNALKQDPRLEYLGSGDFRIVGAESSVVYWPGETPEVDREHIGELSVNVLEAMEAATWNPYIEFSYLQVLGIVKGMGEYLSRDEQNELFALVASNPAVTPLEGGTFKVYKDFSSDPDISEDGLRMVSLDFGKEAEVSEKPMSDKQIGRKMNKINKSVAVRKAADLAKRKANPRRRGKMNKKNKLQGRTHNKAQSITQLIAKMNAASRT